MDIGVGADGSVWVVGTNETGGGFGIYRWTGTEWSGIDGGGLAISVDPRGLPWVANAGGEIFERLADERLNFGGVEFQAITRTRWSGKTPPLGVAPGAKLTTVQLVVPAYNAITGELSHDGVVVSVSAKPGSTLIGGFEGQTPLDEWDLTGEASNSLGPGHDVGPFALSLKWSE